jgi:hypothetical protein
LRPCGANKALCPTDPGMITNNRSSSEIGRKRFNRMITFNAPSVIPDAEIARGYFKKLIENKSELAGHACI